MCMILTMIFRWDLYTNKHPANIPGMHHPLWEPGTSPDVSVSLVTGERMAETSAPRDKAFSTTSNPS